MAISGNIPTEYGLIWYSTSILGSWNSHWYKYDKKCWFPGSEFDHNTRIMGPSGPRSPRSRQHCDATGSSVVSCKGIACHFPGGEGSMMVGLCWITGIFKSCKDLCYPTQKNTESDDQKARDRSERWFIIRDLLAIMGVPPVWVYHHHTSEHTQNHIYIYVYIIWWCIPLYHIPNQKMLGLVSHFCFKWMKSLKSPEKISIFPRFVPKNWWLFPSPLCPASTCGGLEIWSKWLQRHDAITVPWTMGFFSPWNTEGSLGLGFRV